MGLDEGVQVIVIVRWRWTGESQTRVESFDTQASAKRWMREMAKANLRHPDEAQIYVIDTSPSMPIPKALKFKLPPQFDNPRRSKPKRIDLEFAGYKFTSGPEGTVIPRAMIDVTSREDYGADPMGDGTFRMVPSGDIVSAEEKERRLARFRRRNNPAWARVFG